jgi:hypothetical protein
VACYYKLFAYSKLFVWEGLLCLYCHGNPLGVILSQGTGQASRIC